MARLCRESTPFSKSDKNILDPADRRSVDLMGPEVVLAVEQSDKYSDMSSSIGASCPVHTHKRFLYQCLERRMRGYMYITIYNKMKAR